MAFGSPFDFQAELTAAIPKVGASSSSSASSPAVQELRKLMEQVDTIKAERDAMEQDLKEQQDDMGQYSVKAQFHVYGWQKFQELNKRCFDFCVYCAGARRHYAIDGVTGSLLSGSL